MAKIIGEFCCMSSKKQNEPMTKIIGEFCYMSSKKQNEPLLFYLTRILIDIIGPGRILLAAYRCSTLDKVAECGTKSIGGIHKMRHLAVGYVKHSTQHICNLFLRRRTVAGYSQLNLHWSIFVYWNLTAYGSCYGNTLSTTQLEHTLDILAEEWCLNGKFVGKKRGYKPLDTRKNLTEFHVHVLAFAEIDYTHRYETGMVAVHANESISHDIGSRVYPHDDPVVGRF